MIASPTRYESAQRMNKAQRHVNALITKQHETARRLLHATPRWSVPIGQSMQLYPTSDASLTLDQLANIVGFTAVCVSLCFSC